MSKALSKDEILYLQRSCAVCGFYAGPLDGKWSQAVTDAEAKFDAAAAAAKSALGSFDARSESNIATLLPPAQSLARHFLQIAAGFKYKVTIISGCRTYAEQDALYAIGRTVQLNRKPVTKAKGGQSNHNFGIAWDTGIFDTDGRYMTGTTKADQKVYADLAALVKPQIAALEWGGDWSTFPDAPHYQMATHKPIAQVRALFEAGKPLT